MLEEPGNCFGAWVHVSFKLTGADVGCTACIGLDQCRRIVGTRTGRYCSCINSLSQCLQRRACRRAEIEGIETAIVKTNPHWGDQIAHGRGKVLDRDRHG